MRASPEGALGPGLRFLTIQSPALHGRGDLAVHVTEVAEIKADVPVVVLLHGVYGSFWNWMLTGHAHDTLDRMVIDKQVRPMVLVAPSDGMAGEGTAYLEHPTANYERWIMDDVVDCVREFVRQVTSVSPLFLVGNSMGGFGAGRLGSRHASRVAGIGLHSAITHVDQLAVFTDDDIGGRAGLAAGQRDLLASFEQRFDQGDARIPPLYMDCGRDDPLFAANCEFHARLDERGIAHRFHEFDGRHDWDAWAGRLEHSLSFFDSILGA